MSKKTLKITLKSDLCVGSGYAFAGVIDSDICYDACGIPYIPARRLKGCLREAAQWIGFTEEEQERMFGKRGAAKARGIFLKDAYIEGYDKLYESLSALPPEMKEYITPQSVLEQFTAVKAQTRILETGVAKKDSLRFTRIVHHYSPIEPGKELSFLAEVEPVGMTDQDLKNFGQVVKALRHIGLNRNRGLGSVKCCLTDVAANNTVHEGNSKRESPEELEEETCYTLSYSVRNTAPLIMTGRREDQTERYIPGQSVLGCLASCYLAEGNCADEKLFEELFLTNQVIFSALYPCMEEKVFYPAPAYINRRKKTKQYVNVSKEIAQESGNQPKKLKEKFVCSAKDGILVKEVGTEIIYHHTKKSEKQEAQNGELLYPFAAISRNQYFSGTIIGKGKYLKILRDILATHTLRFGKSRSAQYGNCVVESLTTLEISDKTKEYSKDSKILVVLQSDGIFINEKGYTVDCGDVRRIIKETLGIQEESSVNTDKLYAEIEAKELMGHYAKWNLKRQSVPAVCAGSTFEFCLKEALVVPEKKLYAGERIGEGYGKLTIVENSSEDWHISEGPQGDTKPAGWTEPARKLCQHILLKEMRETLSNEALKTKIALHNPSTLGRIILMLTESIKECPNDAEKAYEDFCRRIASIKMKTKQEEIENIRKQLISPEQNLRVEELQYLKYLEPLIVLYKELMEDPESQKVDTELKALWSDYFMHVLIQEKYRQKEEG